MSVHAADQELPAGFAELEGFVSDWALGSEQERNHKRLTSSMRDIQRFYDAMLACMEALLAHLSRFQVSNLPPPEQRLLHLALSLMEIAPAVEVYGAPDVPDAIAASRFVIRSL